MYLEKVKMFVLDHSLDTTAATSELARLRDMFNEMLQIGAETNNVTSHVQVKNNDNEAKIARIKVLVKLTGSIV